MVRELVEGNDLATLLGTNDAADVALKAVVEVSELVARLHRALLLHGDIKPANIIVGHDGRAVLVDLGLAARWTAEGTRAKGLSPRYAAPEIFVAGRVTPRTEVFALGATLAEVMQKVDNVAPDRRAAIDQVIDKATAKDAEKRYPSADEFGEALRRAAGFDKLSTAGSKEHAWPTLIDEQVASELLEGVRQLAPCGGLILSGSAGAGRSTLLRRLAWSLGVGGSDVLFIEARELEDPPETFRIVSERVRKQEAVVIVDDADALPAAELQQLSALREEGAKLVVTVAPQDEKSLPGATFALYVVPRLSDDIAARLLRGMIPSLSDKLVAGILERVGALPGPLREAVRRLEGMPIVRKDDLDGLLKDVSVEGDERLEPQEILRLLDRGRIDDAGRQLAAYADDPGVVVTLARAKWLTGSGKPHAALAELGKIEQQLDSEGNHEIGLWNAIKARAHLRSGDYAEAEKHATQTLTLMGASLLGEFANEESNGADAAAVAVMVADALAIAGITQSLAARHDEAQRTLERSVAVARSCEDKRMLAIALGSLAFAQQRGDKLDDALRSHEEALTFAQAAGDAGHVATTRLNLAAIAKQQDRIGDAIGHLEAAVDMGRRSGRKSTVRQALLNLANLDLYLGRGERAQASIDTLAREREALPSVTRAQLLALEAESAGLRAEYATAKAKCVACAQAYDAMGRAIDAAEAILELVILSVRGGGVQEAELSQHLRQATKLLAGSNAHRPLLMIAQAQVAWQSNEFEQAKRCLDVAVEAAGVGRQRQWLWRALHLRAQVNDGLGRAALAVADRSEAVRVLEKGAAALPRDLREVYWSDPRRRALRSGGEALAKRTIKRASPDVDAETQYSMNVDAKRLGRILAVNRAIAGEYDLERLLSRIAEHAMEILGVESGFVLLQSRSDSSKLSVHARGGGGGLDEHAQFSRSIAERVLGSGEPFFTSNAQADERVAEYVSVHAMMLTAVACVPIQNRRRETIGALYLETRRRAGSSFAEQQGTLGALADQSAIAIETARLVNENQRREKELEKSNRKLARAQGKLEELLGQRTKQLKTTRKNLRSARDLLRGHFGYQDIVGTTDAMRKVYAVIDRIKETNIPVLITGESGTGKEVVARAIHKSGERAKRKMVGLNCGAIPEHLLESELFGHVRGAFTGADRDKKGLFRELDGGTILLDEIGEMPPKMQAGLLRVLQEKVVRPVGGSEEQNVDARVIAATHRDLQGMVADGSFREDLFYRLNVINIRVPALRERAEDIPLLVDHFLRIFASRYKREGRRVNREAMKLLMDFSWPGNVRQLENVLLNAWILSDGDELGPDDFDLPRQVLGRPQTGAVQAPQTAAARAGHEKDVILAALEANNWNRAQAAKQLGMARRTFYRRLKKYDIQ